MAGSAFGLAGRDLTHHVTDQACLEVNGIDNDNTLVQKISLSDGKGRKGIWIQLDLYVEAVQIRHRNCVDVQVNRLVGIYLHAEGIDYDLGILPDTKGRYA